MHPSTWGGSEWQAAAAFIAIFVAGPITLWQVLEARKVRLDQARPYVIIDFEFRSVVVCLTIANIGKTMARDVRIKFDQPPTSTLPESGVNRSRLLSEPIPMLAPGRSMTLIFDSFPARLARREDFPMSYSVSIEYDDDLGRPFSDPPYPLDLDAYVGSAMGPKGIADLVGEVERIRNELTKWTDVHKGLLVKAVDRTTEQQGEARTYWRQRYWEMLREEGVRAVVTHRLHRALRAYGLRD